MSWSARPPERRIVNAKDNQMSIEELAIPATLDAPDAGPFLAAAELANLVARDDWGNDDFTETPQARLAQAQGDDYATRLTLTAVRGGQMLGRAELSLPRHDNLHLAKVALAVHPDHRRRGIGSALLTRITALAAEHGRTVLCAWSEFAATTPAQTGHALAASTGVGAVPSDAPATRFALARGFTLEQVDRVSVLHRPPHRPPTSGPDDAFEMVSWDGHCPDVLVDAYASLRAKMSTAVPLGGVDLRPESWDAARIRADEDLARRRGERLQVTVARHRTTSDLAGHTVLEYYPAAAPVALQGDTLVLPHYRGHGLGRRMKDHNLALASMAWPLMQRIYTFNAEENDHMLAINEAMGFARAGVVATWQQQVAVPQGPPAGER